MDDIGRIANQRVRSLLPVKRKEERQENSQQQQQQQSKQKKDSEHLIDEYA